MICPKCGWEIKPPERVLFVSELKVALDIKRNRLERLRREHVNEEAFSRRWDTESNRLKAQALKKEIAELEKRIEESIL